MPYYHFELDVKLPPKTVAERLQALTRPEPGFWESFGMMWKPRGSGSPPFIGTVRTDSFKLRRDIRYRNSFLPLIRGRVAPLGSGARLDITMFIHPAVGVFLVFWLGGVGLAAFNNQSGASIIPL